MAYLGEGGESFCVAMCVFAIIFFALGIHMVRIKVRKLTPQEKKAARRTLVCKHVGGLPIQRNSVCSVCFEDSEIVIKADENTFHVAFEKIVNLRIDTQINVERYIGRSISGAIIGGAALGAVGAGLLGVKQKKRLNVEEYLIIAYNPRENRVNALVLLPFARTQAERLVKEYLPQCGGERADITL